MPGRRLPQYSQAGSTTLLHSDAWLGARLRFPAANGAPIATLTLIGTPLTRARFRPRLKAPTAIQPLARAGNSRQDGWRELWAGRATMRHRPLPSNALPHMPTPIPIPRFGGSIYCLEGSALFCAGNRRFPCHSPGFVRLFRLPANVPTLDGEEAASTDGARTAV